MPSARKLSDNSVVYMEIKHPYLATKMSLRAWISHSNDTLSSNQPSFGVKSSFMTDYPALNKSSVFISALMVPNYIITASSGRGLCLCSSVYSRRTERLTGILSFSMQHLERQMQ